MNLSEATPKPSARACSLDTSRTKPHSSFFILNSSLQPQAVPLASLAKNILSNFICLICVDL